MISRVAECCFWLHRHAERAESIARLLRVNRSFLLDVNLPELSRWWPVVIVSGEQERFAAKFPDGAAHDDGEIVQQYLTWGEKCPVSVIGSAYWARENARTIRDAISLEMWESINGFWHWLRGGQGRRLFGRDRDAFYQRVKDSVALFQGVCHNTMLHEEPYDFMRLGMLLERAGQTARFLDVKYHLLGPTASGSQESPVEAAQWVALLRSCSAEQSYLRRHRRLSGVHVSRFLLMEELFPRSVYHCLLRAQNFLGRIQSATGRGDASATKLDALVESLRARQTDQVIGAPLHEELTRIIDATMELCDAIHVDFFDPSLPQSGQAA